MKGKGFPYSIPSIGSGADPGVQAVSPQVTISHPPDGRLPLLSARPAVTSPDAEHHCPLAGTKLYCLVTEAHRCERLARGCYAALPRVGFELATYWSQVQCSTHYTTAPPVWRIWGNIIWTVLGCIGYDSCAHTWAVIKVDLLVQVSIFCRFMLSFVCFFAILFLSCLLHWVSSVLSEEIGYDEYLRNVLFLCQVGCKTLTWLTVVQPDTSGMPVLDPFQALTVDQPLIDFEAQSQLISTATSSPVDLLLSASAEQSESTLHSDVSIHIHRLIYIVLTSSSVTTASI